MSSSKNAAELRSKAIAMIQSTEDMNIDQRKLGMIQGLKVYGNSWGNSKTVHWKNFKVVSGSSLVNLPTAHVNHYRWYNRLWDKVKSLFVC